MLIRIVRMTFQPEKVADFLDIFNQSKDKIRARAGCHRLELLRDLDQPNVYMTYSYWGDVQALNDYRDSELFKTTWAKTKILFSDKPVAYSVERLEELL
jgi:quinol monooxygenase YgiN